MHSNETPRLAVWAGSCTHAHPHPAVLEKLNVLGAEASQCPVRMVAGSQRRRLKHYSSVGPERARAAKQNVCDGARAGKRDGVVSHAPGTVNRDSGAPDRGTRCAGRFFQVAQSSKGANLPVMRMLCMQRIKVPVAAHQASVRVGGCRCIKRRRAVPTARQQLPASTTGTPAAAANMIAGVFVAPIAKAPFITQHRSSSAFFVFVVFVGNQLNSVVSVGNQ